MSNVNDLTIGEYLVDSRSAIEEARLNYIHQNQLSDCDEEEMKNQLKMSDYTPQFMNDLTKLLGLYYINITFG